MRMNVSACHGYSRLMIDIRCWMLDFGYLMMDVECSNTQLPITDYLLLPITAFHMITALQNSLGGPYVSLLPLIT